MPDGPADQAGLRGGSGEKVDFQGRKVTVGGDTIVSVDGKKLVAENDLSRLVASYDPGDEVTLEIIRDGKTMNVDVTLGSRPGS